MLPEPEPLLDLGRARKVRGRGFEFRLPLAERVRAARGIPQAVVKVTSYASGKAHVAGHLRYISRNGQLPLETDRGEELTTEGRQMLLEDWAADFDGRPRSRDAAAIVFSMPPGSRVEALKGAVRTTLARSFPDNDWVFAIHEDRDHPHAHTLVKMRGRESGKKLRINKPELYRLRETFAQAAREQGVKLAASPRAARGIGRKGLRQGMHHLRKKGVTPRLEEAAVREAATDIRKGTLQRKPWEKAMEQRHLLEKEAYRKAGRMLRKAAAKRTGAEQEKLKEAARDVERFADTLPEPKSRRQAFIEGATGRPLKRGSQQDADRTLER